MNTLSKGIWARFRKHRLAAAGGVFLLVVVLVAVFAPRIAPYDPLAIDNVHWSGYPLAPGVAGHILGTDEFGRDLLSRLMYGAQLSLTLAISAVGIQLIIGTIWGGIAGYYGGAVDYWLMRLTDVIFSIPLLVLLLVLTAIIADSTNRAALSFGLILVLIGTLSAPATARLVRAEFLSLRERDFIEAARAIGCGDIRIMLRHLLPNALAPIIVQATLSIADVIILESTLAYFGFGIQPPAASWGNMLASAQSCMTNAPWVTIFPGLCILCTVLAFNYLGDGLRDALDPHIA